MSTGLTGRKLKYSLQIQTIDSDLNILSNEVIEPTITLSSSITSKSNFRVPSGTVDQSIQLTDLFGSPAPIVDFLLIRCSGAITFKLNTLACPPIAIAASGVALLDSSGITALYVSNGGTNAVNVEITQGVKA